MADIEGTGFETNTQLVESKLRRKSIELERNLALLEHVANTPVIQDHVQSLRTVEIFLSDMHILLYFEVNENEKHQREALELDPSFLKDLRLQLILLKAIITAISEKSESTINITVRQTLINMLCYLERGAATTHATQQRIDIREGIMTLLAKLSKQDA